MDWMRGHFDSSMTWLYTRLIHIPSPILSSEVRFFYFMRTWAVMASMLLLVQLSLQHGSFARPSKQLSMRSSSPADSVQTQPLLPF